MNNQLNRNWQHAKAIISGGASGLGCAVAESIVAAGGNVVVLDRDIKAGSELVQRLGAQASFILVDVTDGEVLLQAAEQASEKMDGLDLAVSCAGIAPAARLLGRDKLHDIVLFSQALEVNLTGTFNLARAAASVMDRAVTGDAEERGVIVTTSSIAANEGQLGQVAYAASKGGVASMTLPLARELSRIGVRVMCIAPGLFETPMTQRFADEVKEQLEQQVSFPKRLGLPDEYARLVKCIYENAYLNGEIIRLDGGLRMS